MSAPRELPDFAFVGGDVSLDFVNTVDWPTRGTATDRIPSYDRLVAWGERAGVLEAGDAAALRAAARVDPAAATGALAAARRLRGVLRAVVVGVATDRETETALVAFNLALGDALGRLRLVPGVEPDGTPGLALTWEGWGEDPTCVLWPVVRAAANLLATEAPGQIRLCAAPACGWAFVDRSRNGLRRWCRTDVCGARAKARRHYARTRDTARR